jgi:hypothetical protein
MADLAEHAGFIFLILNYAEAFWLNAGDPSFRMHRMQLSDWGLQP